MCGCGYRKDLHLGRPFWVTGVGAVWPQGCSEVRAGVRRVTAGEGDVRTRATAGLKWLLGPQVSSAVTPRKNRPRSSRRNAAPPTPRCPHSEIHIGPLHRDEKRSLCWFVIPAIRNEQAGKCIFLKIHGPLLVGRISSKFNTFSLKNVSF